MILDSKTKRLGAALVSGVMLLGVLNLTPWAHLVKIAPVPLLLAAFYATQNEARLLSLIAATIGLSGNFAYYSESTGGPWMAILLIGLQALAWTFVIPATARIVTGSRHWATLFAYPILWTTIDTLVGNFSPHGSYGSLAYTQADQISSIQIADLAGTPGIVFLTSLYASTLAVGIFRARDIEQPRLAYGLPVAMLAAAFLYGTLQSQSPPSAVNHIKVGLASIDDFIGPRTPPNFNDLVWKRYGTLAGELAKQGARLVLLPEAIENVESPQRIEELADIARLHRIYLGAGLGIREGEKHFNRFWIFDPDGRIAITYDKQRPVPGVEKSTAGNEFKSIAIDGVRFGIAICKDMHFADIGRGYGAREVEAVLVPAWDFDEDAWLTARMTSLRGVESGYAIVRASRRGMLSVSDRFGRMSQEVRSTALPGVSLLADIPIILPSGNTFYARHGDIFGYLCVAMALYLRFGKLPRS